MSIQKNEKFNIEKQYIQWLNLMQLKLDQMHPIQKIQLRQAFYGAVAMMITDVFTEVSNLPDEEAFSALDDMENQCVNYWEAQAKSGGH